MDVKKEYRQLGIYMVVAAALVTALHIAQMALHFSYSWVATASVLAVCLTLRKFCSIFLIETLEYLCSINSYLNKRLEKFLIQKDWDSVSSGSSDGKKKSHLAFSFLQMAIWVFWLVVAVISWLLCWGPAPVMSWKTEHIIHSILTLVNRVGGGFGAKLPQ